MQPLSAVIMRQRWPISAHASPACKRSTSVSLMMSLGLVMGAPVPSAFVSGASHVLCNRMRECGVAFLVFLAQRGYVLRQHLRLEFGRNFLAERFEFCWRLGECDTRR